MIISCDSVTGGFFDVTNKLEIPNFNLDSPTIPDNCIGFNYKGKFYYIGEFLSPEDLIAQGRDRDFPGLFHNLNIFRGVVKVLNGTYRAVSKNHEIIPESLVTRDPRRNYQWDEEILTSPLPFPCDVNIIYHFGCPTGIFRKGYEDENGNIKSSEWDTQLGLALQSLESDEYHLKQAWAHGIINRDQLTPAVLMRFKSMNLYNKFIYTQSDFYKWRSMLLDEQRRLRQSPPPHPKG